MREREGKSEEDNQESEPNLRRLERIVAWYVYSHKENTTFVWCSWRKKKKLKNKIPSSSPPLFLSHLLSSSSQPPPLLASSPSLSHPPLIPSGPIIVPLHLKRSSSSTGPQD